MQVKHLVQKRKMQTDQKMELQGKPKHGRPPKKRHTRDIDRETPSLKEIKIENSLTRTKQNKTGDSDHRATQKCEESHESTSPPPQDVKNIVDSALTRALNLMVIENALDSTLSPVQARPVKTENDVTNENIKPIIGDIDFNNVKLEPVLERTELKPELSFLVKQEADLGDVKFEATAWEESVTELEDIKPDVRSLQTPQLCDLELINNRHDTPASRLNVFEFLHQCISDVVPADCQSTESSQRESDSIQSYFFNFLDTANRRKRRRTYKKKTVRVRRYEKKRSKNQTSPVSCAHLEQGIEQTGGQGCHLTVLKSKESAQARDGTFEAQGVKALKASRQLRSQGTSHKKAGAETTRLMSGRKKPSRTKSDPSRSFQQGSGQAAVPGGISFTPDNDSDTGSLPSDSNGSFDRKITHCLSITSSNTSQTSEAPNCLSSHLYSRHEGEGLSVKSVSSKKNDFLNRAQVVNKNLSLKDHNGFYEQHSGSKSKLLKERGSSLKKVRPKKPCKCDICGKIFGRVSSLNQHYKLHSDERPFVCNVCGMSFKIKHARERHQKIHTGEKPFVCKICDNAFAHKAHLQRHMRVHTGEAPYKCSVCSKAFKQESDLVRHRRTHTGEKPYRCVVCEKSFRERICLLEHQRIHTGEKPFRCDVCGKRFRRLTEIGQHRIIHTGVRRYKCDLCGKAFARLCHIRAHTLVHTGEKPLECSTCGKHFSQLGGLLAHKKIHVKARPFPCDLCPRRFRSEMDLVQHRRCHTGEKPFKCELCDKAFCQRNSLYHHKRLHHKKSLL